MSDDELTWSVHLSRRSPRKTLGALLLVAAGTLAAWLGFQNTLAGILTLLLLTISISDYLWPVHYRLSPAGVEAKGLLLRRRMQWRDVRQVRRDPTGVKLSPLPQPSRLEAYRGIYLWFGDRDAESGGSPEEVMAAIARFRS